MDFQPSDLRLRITQALLNRGPLRAFAYPQFRILWGASLISITTFFMVLIARGWLVLVLTDSPFLVTSVTAVGMLPTLVLSPFGGAIADRLSRRTILIVAEVSNLFLLLIMALLLFADVIQVWHVFALSALNGAAFSLSMPARASIVADVVSQRDLASGVALFSTIFSAGQLIGPALAGYLLNSYGMDVDFLVPCLLLIPAIPVLLLLRLPGPAPQMDGASRKSVLGSILEGLVYVRQRPLLTGLLLIGLVGMVFGLPYQAVLPVFARDVLYAGAAGLGWLGASAGVGAIVGSFAVAIFSSPQQMKWLMITSAFGLGGTVALFAASSMFLLSLGLILILGFMIQVFLTSGFTLIQLASPGHIRGRVLSIRMIVMGLGPIGIFLLGIGSETLGPQLALAIMGIAAVVLTALMLWVFPALRRVERELTEEPASASPGSAPKEQPSPAPLSSARGDQ